MKFNSSQRTHVLRTLEHMKSSEWFANALQLQNFLHYIVSTALDGNTNSLKGYTIGVDALGKSMDFDPSTDPSVRVLAGRLRQAMEAYNRENQNSPGARITLKKGSYVPEFTFPKSAHDTPDKGMLIASGDNFFAKKLAKFVIAPVLILLGLLIYVNSNTPTSPPVLPQTGPASSAKAGLPTVTYEFSYDQNTMPKWISKEMAGSHAIVALSRFKEYRLVPIGSKAARSGADYQITLLFSGSPLEDHLDVFITLYRTKSEEIVWSQRYSFPPPDEENRFDTSMIQVEAIASNLFSAYGIVYGDLLSRKDLPPQLNCIRKIYNYFKNQTVPQYMAALACALSTTNEKNAPSSMHALTALLFVEAYQRGFEHMKMDVLDEARNHATKAVSLDAGNARSYQALFAVERVSGNIDAAILAGTRAMEQNPFDRDILGDFASFLIAINRLEEAMPLLEKADRLTPTPPAWLHFYQFLHADLTGDFERADQILEDSTVKDSPLVAISNLLAFERNGNSGFLAHAIAALSPDLEQLLETPREIFIRRGFSEELATKLASRIERVQKNPAFRRLMKARKN